MPKFKILSYYFTCSLMPIDSNRLAEQDNEDRCYNKEIKSLIYTFEQLEVTILYDSGIIEIAAFTFQNHLHLFLLCYLLFRLCWLLYWYCPPLSLISLTWIIMCLRSLSDVSRFRFELFPGVNRGLFA